jgi:hypothetical protein
MRSNIIIAAGLILSLAIVLTTSRPKGLRAESTWKTEHGIITEMYKTVFNDLAVKLQGQSNIYYIDGALDKGVSLSELKEQLLYKPVVIQYPEEWKPLKNNQEEYFISSLAYNGQVIFEDDK